MTSRKALQRCPTLPRRIFGIGATFLAAMAAIASDYWPDQTRVSLPSQTITLSQSEPKYTSRFRVRSSIDVVSLEVSLSMSESISPDLTMSPIDLMGDTVAQDSGLDIRKVSDGLRNATLTYGPRLSCPASFPCVADFEVTASGANLRTESVSGTLFVTATIGVPPNTSSYLSIEPL